MTTAYQKKDNWALRNKTMVCLNCIHFLLKKTDLDPKTYPGSVGRCRRHAPTLQGFPVVMETDRCGDFKLDEWH